MEEHILAACQKLQMTAYTEALQKSCSTSEKFGLTLTAEQTHALTEHHFAALKESGRVEFGSGILSTIIYAFCDSPFLSEKDYAQTLAELEDDFYYLKNEQNDELPDDELVDSMKQTFDGPAHGSLQRMMELLLTNHCHCPQAPAPAPTTDEEEELESDER